MRRVRPPQTAVDGMEYRLTTPEGASNPLFIGFATDPIVLEHEPNDSRESAQRLSVPCEVSGTFTPTGKPPAKSPGSSPSRSRSAAATGAASRSGRDRAGAKSS